jgi:hypothetical protein
MVGRALRCAPPRAREMVNLRVARAQRSARPTGYSGLACCLVGFSVLPALSGL